MSQTPITADYLLDAMQSSIRYDTPNGSLTVEDLTKKAIKQLKPIVIALRKAREDNEEYYYDETPTTQQQALEIKFKIAEYILERKIAKEKAQAKQREIATELAKLQALKEERKAETLAKLSEAEIDVMISNLQSMI